jgi:polysaccharide deacetylase 2 family uncharacterized protein YibQ
MVGKKMKKMKKTQKAQRTKKKRNKKKNGQNTNLWLLTMFVMLTIASITGLEYIKYTKGKQSFIFNNNVEKQKKPKHRNANIVSFDDRILIYFQKESIKYTHFIDPTWAYHHYKIELKRKKFAPLIQEIKRLGKKYNMILKEIEKVEKEQIYLYSLSLDKKITHKFLISILYKKPKKVQVIVARKPFIIDKKNPKIAFIIDDVGYHETDADNLKALNIPITGSVIPSTPYAEEEGRKLNKFGLQVMIHLPMQAKDPKLKYPKDQFVVLSSSMNDIINLIDRARKIIPFAHGLNNHMGSLITSNREMISKVLTIVKKRGLFFVDSRTALTTVAGKISRRMGIKTAEKDLFIDHVQTYKHSMQQIEKLIRVALYKGKGIAIGHPHLTTFKAIKDSIAKIRAKGIKIVFVSSLLE